MSLPETGLSSFGGQNNGFRLQKFREMCEEMLLAALTPGPGLALQLQDKKRQTWKAPRITCDPLDWPS